MKKLLFILLVFTSCKKEPESVKIQVRDAISNTNVKGVTVDLHRCTFATNPLCGLIAYRSNITGDDGSCRFTKNEYDQTIQIAVNKTDYWGSSLIPKTLLVIIYPEGWMRLRITRGTNYPSQSRLNITMNNSLTGFYSITGFNTAEDSSILVRGYGGQLNKIDWEVRDPVSNLLASGTWNQQIPRLDTVKNITLNY